MRITARAVQPFPSDEPGLGDDLRYRKLHAKVFMLQGPLTTLAYFGSANFTGPGWGFTGTGAGANVEAGVILVRRGSALPEALLPPTTGDPIEIEVGSTDLVLLKEPEQRVPTFIRGIWLEPDSAYSDRLRLAIRVEPTRVRGSFEVTSAGEDCIVLLRAGKGCSDESHIALDAAALERLLREQQVRISWWESAESRDYPVNVVLAARAQLPAVPGCANPSEKLLLAYYQGRISATDLFPPPPGWDDEAEAVLPLQDSEVDTSRIQSYQVRDFVEALQGIRDDLAAASKGAIATMRLAVKGPVSPVSLARQVSEAARAGTRGATAAGFELVEVATCLREAALGDGKKPEWRVLLEEGRKTIESMLDELVQNSPVELGKKTSFARYAHEVLGWRSRRRVTT